jgi:hypothetical protein
MWIFLKKAWKWIMGLDSDRREKIRFIIEEVGVVLLIVTTFLSVFGVKTANDSVKIAAAANKISNETLRVSWIPILDIENLKIDLKDTLVVIDLDIENKSDAPAMKWSLAMQVEGSRVADPVPDGNSMITKNTTREMRTTWDRGTIPLAQKEIRQIKELQKVITFTLKYEDIFGEKYESIQKFKWVENGFNDFDHSVERIDRSGRRVPLSSMP